MDQQTLAQTDPSAYDFEGRTPSAVLRRRATRQGAQVAFTFLLDGETEGASLTYAELDRRARAIAVSLRTYAGRRALLLYPPGLEYVAALFGCFYAGVVAVPVYPPRLNRHLLRLRSILTDAQASLALTDARSLARLESLFTQIPELGSLQWIATDTIPREIESAWREPETFGDSLALLQYTSGSTGVPRGVMLSHRNLAHNSELLARAFEYTPQSLCVSWLPIYHDMGLIGGVLQPLYGGFPCVLMSPASFLQRPARWLKAISQYRATLSGGPNFAYDLCVRRITSEQREGLDLSSWSVAFNGAEPVRHETLQRFAKAFEPCGFRPKAFFPCYGLAEATLIVSGGPKSAPAVVKTVDAGSLERGRVVEAGRGEERARQLTGSGQTVTDERVVIVNPETLIECRPGEVGEIWVSGRSVALGYWNRPEETARTFRAHLAEAVEGMFLRTGDLGFLEDGELFVTGRLKDLIIIRGRNHYPQDIELTLERSDAALRPAAGAAFSIEREGEERLVIVHEVERHERCDFDSLIARIRETVAEEHELQPYAVVLLRAGTIPKTSSGKIQRHACRALFLADDLDKVAEWREAVTPEAEAPKLIPQPSSWETEEIAAYLASQLAARLGLDAAEVDQNRSITHYGLDSLGAIELAHRIESGLGIVLPMLSLLEGHSIRELAARVQAALQESQRGAAALLQQSREGEDFHPLSHGQRALWFLQQTSPESAAYNLACALRIRGDLNRQALRQTFRRLIERHPSLRTSFIAPDGEPLQTLQSQAAPDFIEEDASSWSEETLAERLNEEAHRPFNLEREPVVRIRLFKRSESEHVLLLVAHHIALDFWSLGILLRELAKLYTAEKAGSDIALERPELQYTDYVRWQREMLASPAGENALVYWRKQLGGDLPLLNLPQLRPRPPAQTFRGARLPFKLSVELTRRLKSLARQQGATLYMLLLAVYHALLHRYTGQDTILIGSSAAGRSRAELAGLVGYFVNPLVMRGDLAGDPSFTSFLERVRRTVLEAFEHQDYPFPLLVERLQPRRDPSRTPLFQAMFVLHKALRPEEDHLSLIALGEAAWTRLDELELESVALEQRTAQFELTLAMAETENGLSGAFQYNTDLFYEETIKAMAEHYRTLLEGIVADPHRRLSQLPLLTDEEQRKIVFEWNDTGQDYPSEQLVHRLFEEQAERTPEAVALVSEDEQLSYRELNRRANQLAHHLRTLGVGAETTVGILMERSVEMLVSLLGVLKAGGAYVPLDPEYPQERLSLMLEDAGVRVLLAGHGLIDRVAAAPEHVRVVCVAAEWKRITEQSAANVLSEARADNLAYVVYTSGSTGRPKGVMISHHSLVNYLSWCVRAYDVAGGSGAPVHSSIGFDLTVTSLFAPLLAGRSVVLGEAQGAETLTSALQLKTGYSFVKLTPSHLNMMNRMVAAGDTPPEMAKMLILGGEALSGESLCPWHPFLSQTRIINEYGPTETVVGCCVYEVKESTSLHGMIPIGRPIANTQLYILDEHLNPLPPGVTGELFIGGDGLARGYRNSPDLTAQKFIPHPFSREAGTRLYRTGDRARYLPDGNIEFLGRFDEQIKLRGYRVEPGEVEAVLRGHPAIREGVVIVNEDAHGALRLSAYFIPENAGSIKAIELRRYLKERLPDYMVPTALTELAELPLTANGKVDRKALRALERDRPELTEEFTAPRTETEKTLAEIWSQVLDIRHVGVHDNFFELGGHSLLAAQIISRARDAFSVELPLSTLLKSPTVAHFAEAIDEARSNNRAARRSRIVPASRAARRATLSEDGATVLSLSEGLKEKRSAK